LKSTWAAIGRHAIDGLPGDEYIALARLLETGDHAQRRRLAASRGAEKRQEFACTAMRSVATTSPNRFVTQRNSMIAGSDIKVVAAVSESGLLPDWILAIIRRLGSPME
jgi:hypothetical protein